MPIDTYIFHYGLTQWFQALILRSLRRVLKSQFKISIPLTDSYNKLKQTYRETADKVINHIITNERYIQEDKTIIPIPISLVIKEEEPPQEGEGAESPNENGDPNQKPSAEGAQQQVVQAV